MTRSRHLTHAAGPRTKDLAGVGAAPASMKFTVFEDNGGAYHWALAAASGERLVTSASFASYSDAKQAASVVRGGAGTASLEDRVGATSPLELATRPERATVRDDLDAERWLDEGGSFTSEAVNPWPAQR